MKKIIKAIPYSSYDIDSISLWLEENAEKGLFLKNRGLGTSFASFEEGEPRKVKYRFIPETEKDEKSEPDDAAKEMMDEFGWRLLQHTGNFFLYVNTDINAVEPITEPDSVISALTSIREKNAGRLAVASLMLLLSILKCVLLPVSKDLWAMKPLFLYLISVLIWATDVVSQIFKLALYYKFKKHIINGTSRKKAKKTYISLLSLAVLLIALLSFILSVISFFFVPS